MYKKSFSVFDREELFIELIRHEASFQTVEDVWDCWLKAEDSKISKHGSSFLDYYKNQHSSFYPSRENFTLSPDGKTWIYMNSSGHNFFDLYCKINNMDAYQCANKYSKLYNFEYNKLLGIDSTTEIEYAYNTYKDNTPDKITLQCKTYNKVLIENIYNTDSLRIGAYIKYASDTDYFYLYGRISEFQYKFFSTIYLLIGRNGKKIHLYNYHKFNYQDNKELQILFFMSLDEAIKKGKNNNFIATSCLDMENDPSKIDFSFLHRRDIYFIPEPSKESILKCLKFIDELVIDPKFNPEEKRVAVSGIHIHPTFWPNLPDVEKERLENSTDPFDRYLAETSLESNANSEVGRQSLSVSEFKQKMRALGVIELERDDSSPTIKTLATKFRGEVHKKSQDESGECSLEKFLSPSLLTGIVGQSDSGKTMLAMTMAVSLATGQNYLDFKVTRPHNVLYIDCETSRESASIRIKRVSNACNADIDLLNKKFIHISLIDNKEMLQNINLLDDKFQDWIRNLLQEHNAEYIFFDNLLTLGDNLTHTNNWQKVLEYFRSVSNNNCAVVFCHHLDRDGGIKGIENIENLSQNIIKILGNKYIKEKYPQLDSLYENSDCVLELTYEKSRGDINRKNTKQIWKLEYNSSEPSMGGAWIRLDKDSPQNNTDNLTNMDDHAIEIFIRNTGRNPKLEGGSNDKFWKKDIIYLFAIKKYLQAKDTGQYESAWFALKDITVLEEVTDQTKRNLLDDLTEERYLDKTKTSRENRWKYKES